MSRDLKDELIRITGAVEFHSTERFTFASYPGETWRNGAEQAQPQILQNALYAHCYTRPFTGAIPENQGPTGTDQNEWIEALSAANTSKDRWEEGWQVRQLLPNGQVSAEKNGMTRAFWAGEFISRSGFGMGPRAGTPIAGFFPRESRTLQSGFYFVFGETAVDQYAEFPTVRYYWNLKREGAVPLVETLTRSLNKYQVPFRFKILSHPSMLGRSDGAVLYLGRRYYRVGAELCREAQAKVGAGLDSPAPLFTLPLADGLAFAEDTNTAESFGMSRCRLLAEALCFAFQEGRTGTEDRLERIRTHFAASGVSLEKPYLNNAATDTYEFPQ